MPPVGLLPQGEGLVKSGFRLDGIPWKKRTSWEELPPKGRWNFAIAFPSGGCQQGLISLRGTCAEWEKAALALSRRKPVPWSVVHSLVSEHTKPGSKPPRTPVARPPGPVHNLSSCVRPGCPEGAHSAKELLDSGSGVYGILLGPSGAGTELKGTRCVLTRGR